ncbi:MAG: hypothetical protein IKI74_00915 [Christensenellaceae bacterium]|nr:hypothetical protein [Christensenellaceae bacterium]
MKNGFYMGYDASCLDEKEISRQADLLLDTGLYNAGYQVIRLGRPDGRFSDIGAFSGALKSRGFSTDITLDNSISVEEAESLIRRTGAQMITVDAGADHEAAERLIGAAGKNIRVAVKASKDDLAWASGIADVVIIDSITDDADFFEITRNQLDSCRDGDTDPKASEANLRADAMEEGGTYQPGDLPLKFDFFRNEAVFIQFAMLGCPLVINGDIAGLGKKTLELLKNREIIHVARAGLGRTARYYDPWHVLITKPFSSREAYAFILNRCHGDTKTDIVPGDVGWDDQFACYDLLENRIVAQKISSYEIHVETSDHPETPCCRLYRLEH